MEERQMALLLDPFDALASFQQAVDAYRASSWLDPGLSGGGAYPPLNVFRKGDDFIVIAELPGVQKSDLDVQVKGRTIRLAGEKTVGYPEKAALHRRERLAGRFDRAVTMPVEINPDGVKAEYRDGILALFLPRAESDKPKSIEVA
jgi:HSP20 family protein